MSISCRGLVNQSTHTFFPNINLTKTMTNLLVVSKITEKWLHSFMFPLLYVISFGKSNSKDIRNRIIIPEMHCSHWFSMIDYLKEKIVIYLDFFL